MKVNNGEESKKEFYGYMKRAITSSLLYLQEKAAREQITLIQVCDFKIDTSEKSWDIIPRSYRSLASFAKSKLDEILELPDVAPCLDFMMDNSFHEKIEMGDIEDEKTYKRFRKFLGLELIGMFLSKYVETKGAFDYDELVFDKLYNELEEYIYTDGREIIAIAPLLNFELRGIERIDLEDFTIRKITEDEIKMLLGNGALGEEYFLLPYGGNFDATWCIELKARFPSKKKHEGEDLEADIYRIVTALRLFKKGSIQYSAILTYGKVWKLSHSSSVHRRTRIYGLQYVLTVEDVKRFELFWKAFRKLDMKNHRSLDLAIRRFNFSYERNLPEDKLIDLITAFEALYLKGTKEELTYKLALRFAHFIGKNKEDREHYFATLKGAYNIRSKVVHGEQMKPDDLDKELKKLGVKSLAELVIQVRGYLAESIKTFINDLDSKSHDNIIEGIDKKIIAGVEIKKN